MQEIDSITQLTQDLKAEDRLTIADPSSASISYPTFWEHLSQLAQ